MSSLGPGSLVLIDQLNIVPKVITIDTGYLFKESKELRNTICDRYQIHIQVLIPTQTISTYEIPYNQPLYKTNPDQCCTDRKILPLKEALSCYEAWMSGIRHDQTSLRAQTPKIAKDQQFNIIKLSPLIEWSKHEIWEYIKKHEVPYNPLLNQGYASVSFWPYTQKTKNKDNKRSGSGKIQIR